MAKRRKYSEEFKREAIGLAKTSASFSIPPTAQQKLGMIAVGANPSTVAYMNNGVSCGITGLGDAGSMGCGGIRGFSVGAGLLVGGSFVTDVKWEACCENK